LCRRALVPDAPGGYGVMHTASTPPRRPHPGAPRRRSLCGWAILLALVGAAACREGSEGGARLTVGTYWGSAASEALHRELILVTRDIGDVAVEVRPFTSAALSDFLLKGQARGGQEALDLAVVPHEWLARLQQRELVEELPTEIVQELRQKLVAQALLAATEGEHVLAFPIGANVLALVYDPSVFATPPDTIEEVLSAPAPAGALPFAFDASRPSHLAGFVSSLQGTLVDAQGYLVWRGDAVAEILARLRPTWERSGGWRSCRGADLESLQLQLYAEGKLSSFLAGPWMVHALEEIGRPFAVVPIPRLAGAPYPARALVGYDCVIALRGSRWTDMALEIGKRLLMEGPNERLSRATGRLPVLMGSYESSQGMKTSAGVGFLRALEAGQFIPSTMHWGEGFSRAEAQLLLLSGRPQPPTAQEISSLLGGGRT
jgi:maltose-binding protein MalE